MKYHAGLPAHIEAMFRPETYPHVVATVEMIQTHISWVFLTGIYAYKFKKPLHLSFLDFSTLPQRKFYCEQELVLNRRLSADMYLAVLPLAQQGVGEFALQGTGKVIDYCLKMRQFEQSDLLNICLERDQFDPVWMDQLAQSTAAFHDAQPGSKKFGHPQMFMDHIQINLDTATDYEVTCSEQLLEKSIRATLTDFASLVRRDYGKELLARQQLGFVRPCHGDLHLKNITLIHARPFIFDCIEFNDEFRIIDTMNDVAFLVMDCDARGRPDLGWRFLSRYLEYNGDYAGLNLFTLYLFYRATVRAKVSILLALERMESTQFQSDIREARHYYALAATYTTEKEASLFVVGGLSGSGKSHLALLGCGHEHAIIIRSDATRKRIADSFPALDLYGSAMHGHTYESMFADARIALAAGFSVILDATFLQASSRQQVYDLARQCRVALHFFWLDQSIETLQRQIANRQAKADDISDADLSVLQLQLAEYQRPDEDWIQFLDSTQAWPSLDGKKPV